MALPKILADQLRKLGATEADLDVMTANEAAKIIAKKNSLPGWRTDKGFDPHAGAVVEPITSTEPWVAKARTAGVPDEQIRLGLSGNSPEARAVRQNVERGFVWRDDKFRPVSKATTKPTASPTPDALGTPLAPEPAAPEPVAATPDAPAKKPPVVERVKSRAKKPTSATALGALDLPASTTSATEPVAPKAPAKKQAGKPAAPAQADLFAASEPTPEPPAPAEPAPTSKPPKPAGFAGPLEFDDSPDRFQQKALHEAGFSERSIGVMSRADAEKALGGAKVSGLGDPDVGGPDEFQHGMLKRLGYTDEELSVMTRKDAEHLVNTTPLSKLRDAPANDPLDAPRPRAPETPAAKPVVDAKAPMEPADPSSGKPASAGRPAPSPASPVARPVTGTDRGTPRQGRETSGFASPTPRSVGPDFDRSVATAAIQEGTGWKDNRSQIDAIPNDQRPPEPRSSFASDPEERAAIQERVAARKAGTSPTAQDLLLDSPHTPTSTAPSKPLGFGDKARMAVGRAGGALQGLGPVGQLAGAFGIDLLVQRVADELASRQTQADAAATPDVLRDKPRDAQGFVVAPPIRDDQGGEMGMRPDGSLAPRAPQAAAINAQIDQQLAAPPPAPSAAASPAAPAPDAQADLQQGLADPGRALPPGSAVVPDQGAAPAPAPQPAPQAAAPQRPAQPIPGLRPRPPASASAPAQPVREQPAGGPDQLAEPSKFSDQVANARFRNDLDQMFEIMKGHGISGFRWGNHEFEASQSSPSGFALKGTEPPAGPTTAASTQPPSPLQPIH